MAGDGIQRARSLRKRSTAWERLLWKHIRAHKIGYHFRRQHPFGPYVLDFYCHESKLCIELDSDQHAFRADRDAERDRYLEGFGIYTLRLSNGEVGADTFQCIERIMKLCADRLA